MRLAHRVKELDKLPHNLSDMPSIKKVRNWYAQSFEVRPFPRSSPRSSSHTPSQELISFPPVVLPPDIRQALMVPRPENSLPESTPNLALRHFNDPALHASNAPSNGFNKLKLRVPMERRCPPSPFPPCLSSISSPLPSHTGTTPTRTTSSGRRRCRTTTSASQRCSRRSRRGTTRP